MRLVNGQLAGAAQVQVFPESRIVQVQAIVTESLDQFPTQGFKITFIVQKINKQGQFLLLQCRPAL